MAKKIHMGTFDLRKGVGGSWNRIDTQPSAEAQDAIDLAHRADVHNANAMAEYERQQALARMKAKLAQFKQDQHIDLLAYVYTKT